VGTIDRKTKLFEHIVRLRRAERDNSLNEDLMAVRADLERELGATVSRSLAARLLGVRHSSLQRWIDTRDIPVAIDDRGHVGVPVAALADLYENVQRQREREPSRRHVLEPALVQGRLLAQKLKPKALVADEFEADAVRDPHDRAALRSLAYHRAVARRLRRSTIDQARRQIWRWRNEGRIDARYADEWDEILRRPVSEVRQAIGENTREMADLRQSSPFAGALSEAERNKILEEIR
jgi:hypothetical protein